MENGSDQTAGGAKASSGTAGAGSDAQTNQQPRDQGGDQSGDKSAGQQGAQASVRVMTSDDAWNTIDGKIAELPDGEREIAQAGVLILRNFLADLHALAAR